MILPLQWPLPSERGVTTDTPLPHSMSIHASAARAPRHGGTARKARGASNAAGDQTRSAILDVAEGICAKQGFEALSVRSISDAANVNVAAITYHFGGKAQLFEEMFRRRVQPLNEQRLAMLDSALAGRGSHQLEEVIRAFVAPPLTLAVPSSDAGGNSALVVMQFLSRVFAMPGESDFLRTYYEPVRSRFVLALKHLLPDLSVEEVIWRYNLMVGAIIYAMGGTERMERPPTAFAGTPMHFEHDPSVLVERTVAFLAAGFRAAADHRPG